MYRLNPVRIRRGVIWARLPSFWLPSLDGGPGGKARREGGEEPRVCVTVCVRARGCVCVCCTSQSLVVFSSVWMSQTACVTIILSLFLPLSKHACTHTQVHTVTHTPDSCVWLGKCLWLTPIPPTSFFFRFVPQHPHQSFLLLQCAPQPILCPAPEDTVLQCRRQSFTALPGPLKMANIDP